jgi:hypothetical protein
MMKKKLLLLLAIPVAAAIGLIVLFAARGGTLRAYYVYNNPCESCREYENFLETFQTALGDEAGDCEVVRVYLLNNEGWETFQSLCRKLDIPEEERTLPMLVIGKRYISGMDNIARNGRALYEAAKTGKEFSPQAN